MTISLRISDTQWNLKKNNNLRLGMCVENVISFRMCNIENVKNSLEKRINFY